MKIQRLGVSTTIGGCRVIYFSFPTPDAVLSLTFTSILVGPVMYAISPFDGKQDTRPVIIVKILSENDRLPVYKTLQDVLI